MLYSLSVFLYTYAWKIRGRKWKRTVYWLNENANDLNKICMALVVCARNQEKLSHRKNILAIKTEWKLLKLGKGWSWCDCDGDKGHSSVFHRVLYMNQGGQQIFPTCLSQWQFPVCARTSVASLCQKHAHCNMWPHSFRGCTPTEQDSQTGMSSFFVLFLNLMHCTGREWNVLV